jgi:threonine dehydrogenase-like Zn-dependent dehydrogenase
LSSNFSVVIAVDIVDYRLQKAKEVGADVILNVATKEALYNAVMKETGIDLIDLFIMIQRVTVRDVTVIGFLIDKMIEFVLTMM